MERSAEMRIPSDQDQALECALRQHRNVPLRLRESNSAGTAVTAVMPAGVTSRRDRVSTCDVVPVKFAVPRANQGCQHRRNRVSVVEIQRKYQLHFGDAPLSANCACVC